MTLSFSTKLNGNPTYFQEKIIECLLRDISIEIHKLSWAKYLINTNLGLYVIGSKRQKRHTIREDKSNRWKAGNNIHFVINNRTPDRFQFAPVVKCVRIQRIEIIYEFPNNPEFRANVFIDDSLLDSKEVLTLAVNDGFESIDDFFAYFNKGFIGKIIHWTDLKY